MQRSPFYRSLPYIACVLACATVNTLYFPASLVFPDEQRFWASSVNLAATGEFWVGGDRAFEMPGPAAFFALMIRLAGADYAIIAIRTAQSLLVLMQVRLVATLSQRLWQNEISVLIAAWIAALYPFLLFYQGLLLSETLFNLLLLASMVALVEWSSRGTRIDIWFVLTCMLFASATYAKASLTLLPPLLLALAAWLSDLSFKRSICLLVLSFALYIALLSPWAIRNAYVLHAFVPLTTSSGENLYLGNNPKNRDAGIDWASDVDKNEAARLFAVPDEVSRNRAFTDSAKAYIAADPLAFLNTAVKKFIRFWNVIPNAAEYRGFYAAISALSFGPVLVLALYALLLHWRRWRTTLPFVVVMAYFTLLHSVTIASVRYRLPLEPLLISLAAQPLAEAWNKLRGRPVDQSGSFPLSKPASTVKQVG